MNADAPWHAFYQSDLQSLWALVVVPAAFLVTVLVRPARPADPQERFVLAWSIAFAIETILDPIATGPLVKTLDLADAGQQAVMLCFVLLGDWRVLLLAFALAYGSERRGQTFAHSAALCFVVPIFAYLVDAGLRSLWPGLPGQALWLVYELGFGTLALTLRRRLGIAAREVDRRLLRALLAYAAAYYALWACADALILAGSDRGWALRILPNQMYYAWTVPFVYFARGSALRALIARK